MTICLVDDDHIRSVMLYSYYVRLFKSLPSLKPNVDKSFLAIFRTSLIFLRLLCRRIYQSHAIGVSIWSFNANIQMILLMQFVLLEIQTDILGKILDLPWSFLSFAEDKYFRLVSYYCLLFFSTISLTPATVTSTLNTYLAVLL